jgi:hypothetical protein
MHYSLSSTTHFYTYSSSSVSHLLATLDRILLGVLQTRILVQAVARSVPSWYKGHLSRFGPFMAGGRDMASTYSVGKPLRDGLRSIGESF